MVQIQKPAGMNVAVSNPLGKNYVSGNQSDNNSARFLKETGEVMVFQEKANNVWNPGSLRIASDTLDLGHDIGLSAIGDHVRFTTIEAGQEFVVLGVEYDINGTKMPEVLVLGTRVDEDPIQSTFDTELTVSTETGEGLTFANGQFIYTLYLKTGPVAAADDVKVTVSRGLVEGGAEFFSRNYPASDFPANSDITLNMLAGIAFDTGDEGFFKFESDSNLSFLGNSSGNLYMAVDQQPETEVELVADILTLSREACITFDREANFVVKRVF